MPSPQPKSTIDTLHLSTGHDVKARFWKTVYDGDKVINTRDHSSSPEHPFGQIVDQLRLGTFAGINAKLPLDIVQELHLERGDQVEIVEFLDWINPSDHIPGVPLAQCEVLVAENVSKGIQVSLVQKRIERKEQQAAEGWRPNPRERR